VTAHQPPQKCVAKVLDPATDAPFCFNKILQKSRLVSRSHVSLTMQKAAQMAGTAHGNAKSL
jgi:hypothetical protein